MSPLTSDQRRRIATDAFIRIVEAARRVRPMMDSVPEDDLSDSSWQGLASAALDSYRIIIEYHEATDGLGQMRAVENALMEAETLLLGIASVITVAESLPGVFHDRPETVRALWNSAICMTYKLEDLVGPDWTTADFSIAERWAAEAERAEPVPA